ncbi:MAG: hypothetical protein V1821_01615, partial [bacterium]
SGVVVTMTSVYIVVIRTFVQIKFASQLGISNNLRAVLSALRMILALAKYVILLPVQRKTPVYLKEGIKKYIAVLLNLALVYPPEGIKAGIRACAVMTGIVYLNLKVADMVRVAMVWKIQLVCQLTFKVVLDVRVSTTRARKIPLILNSCACQSLRLNLVSKEVNRLLRRSNPWRR